MMVILSAKAPINCHKQWNPLSMWKTYLFPNTYETPVTKIFIHSLYMCRVPLFLAVLRSFFHSSLLFTFSCYSSPTTILPSSLTPSCHLFLGLPLNLVIPKFIYNTLFRVLFFPFSVHVQTNVTYLTLLSLL